MCSGNKTLYPVQNEFRFNQLLNSMWNFEIDPDSIGIKEKWYKKLPKPESMPVPGTFAELTTKRDRKYYTGDFWYEKDVFVPSFLKNKDIAIRFGSITHRAKVFFNSVEVKTHEGGFLPFEADITKVVKLGQVNHLAILVNNKLSLETIPCGDVTILSDGRKADRPRFDFFNYSGIMRNVWLVATPKGKIIDFDLKYDIQGKSAQIHYQIYGNGDTAKVELTDRNGNTVAVQSGLKNSIDVKNTQLWSPACPYLYGIKIQLLRQGKIIDEYSNKIGIRTVKVLGTQILLNDKPIHLKGFGKHEDFTILGKATSESVIKRDFECMKWIGVNCFRTSHYPYAEEWYREADRYGFLIIDEVPAVGLSSYNFIEAAKGKFKSFFTNKNNSKLEQVHEQEITEMINRDKNHPSVIVWSLFNEPESTSNESYHYFKKIFNFVRENKLDPQARPLTGALENHSQPDTDRLSQLCDIVSLNRYYGWYVKGGQYIQEAKKKFIDEMNGWERLNLNKPFIFTEFGADTLASEHRLPAEMWSQEYQNEVIHMFFDVFKQYNFIQGELIWNFADFKTEDAIARVGGNQKGIFTRDRQPKDAAFLLRKLWK